MTIDRTTNAGRQPCAPEYVTPAGEPCVPGRADIDCEDLAQWGISSVAVIGDDVHSFDVDSDGTGCENNITPRATSLGESVSSIAEAGTIVGAIFLAVLCIVPVRLAWRAYHEAPDDAERRSMRFNVAMTVGSAFTLALIGAFVFALLGIER